jgi:Fe-S-cluster containining protein
MSAKFDLSLRATKTRVTCTVGCASCCYHPVSISILEGILIYRWLKDHNKWTTKLKQKLQDVADRQYGTSYEVWLFALIPCPLLTEDKKCSAYEARPLICRAYYAKGDPHYCHPHRLGSSTQIVDRTTVVEPYHEEQEKILRRHQLQFLTMPIGTAVLLGEKVCNEEINLGAIDRHLFREYVEKG